MSRKNQSFRTGKVTGYLRGEVWYLCYYENGRRCRPRVGTDKSAARQLAAQTNAQLATGGPAPMSFVPIKLSALRDQWLDYHEDVLRSSVATIQRYRTATAHLIRFIGVTRGVELASHFRPAHAEAFAAHLRRVKVAPNGHPNATKRPLSDKGVKYILEVSRSLFNYAGQRRHLPPYAENPFSAIGIDRIPIEDSKPFIGLTSDQERRFLESCDNWAFPIFLTLMLTGMRPGELTHALLPNDLDLDGGWLHVRNKRELGWRVKTRNDRAIPLVPELISVLRSVIGNRAAGPAFLRRRYLAEEPPALACLTENELRAELIRRVEFRTADSDGSITRETSHRIAQRLWRDCGAIKTDEIRTAFKRLTGRIELPHLTAPMVLRHMFATTLQDANVDPLIRNQLMGHVSAERRATAGGLGMTGTYTHTRPETARKQMAAALSDRAALAVAREWLAECACRGRER